MDKRQETNQICMYKAFFEMMKKWIIRDYYNPSIKAEVVLDTLLSEFICELLQYGYKSNNTFRLLAKEFPVKPLDSDSSSLRFPKLDYLVEDDKNNLYFVELKTSSDSFDEEQYQRYKAYAVSTKDNNSFIDTLWKGYCDILKAYKIINKYDAINEKKKYSDIVTGTKKYVYQLSDFKREGVSFAQINDSICVEKIYSKIFLVYLSLQQINSKEEIPVLTCDGNKPNVSQIVLSQIIKDNTKDNAFTKVFKDNIEKENKWKAVREILEELIDNNGKLRDCKK